MREKSASPAARSLAWSGKTVPSGAGSPGLPSPGVSKATPPVTSAWSDSTVTAGPWAPRDTDRPLAFQKRLFGRTMRS